MADDASSSGADGGFRFTVTKRFSQALTLLQGIEVRKLPILVSRIIGNLNDDKSSRVFTEEEEEQIRALFEFSQSDLDTVVDASSYIFEQAAYHGLDAASLLESLQAAGLEKLQAMAFAKVWHESGDAFLDKLKAHTLGAPKQLDAVSWRLQMTMGQRGLSKTKDLNAVFNLELVDESASEEAEARESITVQFDQAQLEEFYEQLEMIQSQLDALTAS